MALPRRQQPQPKPNRSHSLWRGCLFATAGGWWKGYRAADGGIAEDDQTMGIGTQTGGNIRPHVHDSGWFFDSDGVISIGWPVPLSRYDVTRGLSVAIVSKQEITVAAANVRSIKKRAGEAAINPGWDIHIKQVTQDYNFEISDGVTETSAGVFVLTNGITDIIVGTYDRTTLKCFANGRLNEANAATQAVGNNTETLRIFGPVSTGQEFDGDIAMVGVWNRPLADSEIRSLYVDPYVMWRHTGKDYMFGFPMVPPGPGLAVAEDCCCPCCGSRGVFHFGIA